MGNRRIAVVVPNLTKGGGVTSSANFIYEVISRSGRYDVDLFSLATSASDSTSTMLRKPTTWPRGVRVESDEWRDRPIRHFGARWAELEFSRYSPRQMLSDVLNTYDLVQVVAGTPAWAYVCKDLSVPVALHVASLVRIERESALARQSGPLALWRRGMTAVNERIEVKAINSVDMVFAMNPGLCEALRNDPFNKERVILAPPGVDTDLFKPAPNGQRSDDFILSVGRLSDPRKNVPLLIRAYAGLVRKAPHAPGLVLAGSQPPAERDMNLAAELGVASKIKIMTSLSVSDLADLYRNALMFVLASNEEGFGLVVTEAMASGAPTISTRSGGPDTIINDGVTGILIPLNDADKMTESMYLLLASDEKRRSMGELGRTSIVERYSNHATEKIFLKTYDRMLAVQR